MAQDNILGIQATINGKDIKQGADEFMGQVSRMERASDRFISNLAGKSRMVNGQVESIGTTFEDVVGVITKGAAALGIAFSAQQFVTQVARTRGEFQQLEVAFNTMLGSAEKAGALMAQITRTAAVTPFGLQDVAGGAKQLLAYGVASEQVNDTLIRLGDIAAGLSIPLNDLVYLYGTTMTQGRLFTQDLRQFQGRGIPLADELAKQFGVTKDRVGELVTAGKVGFGELEKAIVSMTSEGGKFGGLMEAQSKTILGQWSNIQDAIDGMFNEIGKSQEGVINTALQGISLLVENYETVGRSILALVATYGTYKAALITTIVLHKSWAVAARADATAKAVLTAATKAQTVAQLALNAAMKANPYVLLATAVVGLGTAMWALSEHTSAAEKGLQEYNAEQEKFANQQEHAKQELERLVNVLNDENAAYSERDYAMRQMKALYPDLAQMFMDEKGHISDLAGLWEAYGNKAKEAKLQSQEAKVAGLSTELTIATNNYNTAKANSNWGGAKKYKEQVENITAQLTQAKKDLSVLVEEQKKAESQPEVKNKSYWEKKKKDAEDARDALDETKKNSKEWQELERQIIEADKALQQWDDPTKRRKKDDSLKEKEEEKNRELLKIKRRNEETSIEFEEDAARKRRAQIELEYKNDIDAYREAKRKYGSTAEVEEMKNVAEKKKERAELQIFKEEAVAMREFLREYGSYQQQKLAIAEEYAEKIAKAQTDGEKKLLERERNKKVQGVEISVIKQQIDWGSVFGSFGTMFKDQIEPTIERLQEIMKSDTFRSSSIEEQKLLYDIIGNLQKSTTIWDGDVFTKVSKDLDAYQKALSKYNEVMNSSTASAEEVTEAQNELAESTSNLQMSSERVSNMFTELSEGLRGLSSGSLEGIGRGLMQLDQLFGEGGITKNVGNALAKGFTKLFGENSEVTKTLTKALGDSGFIGELIAAVLSILDILKEGIGTLVASLIDTILGAIDGILSNILSLKFVEQIGGSLVKGVGNILDTVTRAIGNIFTFGLASGGISDWFRNSNAGEVIDTTDRLTARNEILTQSIDALKNEIEKARGAQSLNAYEKAVEKQKELIENTGDILAVQMGYHNAHHSNSYYIAQALTESDWAEISSTVGKKVASTSDLWNLSPEDLKKVSQLTEIWDKIYNGGRYDKSEYINAYLELAGSIEEMGKELNESLTQVSFNSMYDGFLNTLMEMDSKSKDFADTISEYFMKAMLTNKIGELYSKELEDWYNKFADYMKSDTTLTENEMAELRNEYQNIVSEAIAERDAIASATGYDKSVYSQEASSKEFQGMSQDTGDELKGRFTALQVAGEEIRKQSEQQTVLQTLISTDTATIKQDMAIQKQYISEIVDIQYESVGYLAEISKNTKQLFQMNERLGKIEENTRNM